MVNFVALLLIAQSVPLTPRAVAFSHDVPAESQSVAVGVIGLGYGIWRVGFAGPTLSAEDIKRAELQAQAGNHRMQGYIPQGAPGSRAVRRQLLV
jgi:hypothetical protein